MGTRTPTKRRQTTNNELRAKQVKKAQRANAKKAQEARAAQNEKISHLNPKPKPGKEASAMKKYRAHVRTMGLMRGNTKANGKYYGQPQIDGNWARWTRYYDVNGETILMGKKGGFFVYNNNGSKKFNPVVHGVRGPQGGEWMDLNSNYYRNTPLPFGLKGKNGLGNPVYDPVEDIKKFSRPRAQSKARNKSEILGLLFKWRTWDAMPAKVSNKLNKISMGELRSVRKYLELFDPANTGKEVNKITGIMETKRRHRETMKILLLAKNKGLPYNMAVKTMLKRVLNNNKPNKPRKPEARDPLHGQKKGVALAHPVGFWQ